MGLKRPQRAPALLWNPFNHLRWRGHSATCSNGRLPITGSIVKMEFEAGAIPDMAVKPRKTALPGRLVGYARVSTEEQGTDPQLDELRAAGCASVLEEHASGADRSRPVLARLLREIRRGETLVVVRLDRLARSVSPLLAVPAQL